MKICSVSAARYVLEIVPILIRRPSHIYKKGNVIPLQARCGPEGG